MRTGPVRANLPELPMRSMRSMRSMPVFILFALTTRLYGADPEPPRNLPEAILPETTLLAVSVPDFSETRTAFKKTRVADMFAEPEMQQFLAPACEQLRKTYDELRAKNPLLPALADLEQVFTGEVTLALYNRDANAKMGEFPAGFAAVLRPKDLAAFNRIVPAGALEPNAGDPMAPAMAQANGRVLFVFPGEDLSEFLKRLNAPPPRGTLATRESFTSARKMLQFASGYAFADPVGFLNLALPAANLNHTVALNLQNAIDGLAAVMLGVGFNKDEIVLEGCVRAIPGKRPGGLLALLLNPDQPVGRTALKIASADAPFVSAGHVDWAGCLSKIRRLLAVADPGRQVDFVLMFVNKLLGFDLDKDLLASLGTETVYAQSALDTAVPLSTFNGGVMSIAVRDTEKMDECLKKVFAALGAHPGNALPLGEMLQFLKTECKGRTIYHLKQLMSSSWSFCLYGDRLLIGNSLNALKRSLEQLAGETDILANPEFQATIARVSAQPFNADKLPSGFAFQTDAGCGGGSLALAGLGLAGGAGGLAGLAEVVDRVPLENGVGDDPLAEIGRFLKRPSGKVLMDIGASVDLGLWPDEGFFMKYRRTRGACWTSDPLGVYFRTELPFPVGGFRSGGGGPLVMIAVVGIAAAAVLPVLSRARDAAQRASSANNLGQMGKALIMYSDVPAHDGKYPQDPADLYPDYIADARIFSNPRFKGQDVGYIYIASSTPDDAMNIVAFENVSAGSVQGRNILLAVGSVEWRDENSFQEELKKTEEALKAKGAAMKQVPISFKQIAGKKK